LQSGFSEYEFKILCWVSITLRKLLEAETSVPEDLPRNISCCRNFHASTDHFKGAPVLVLHKIPDKFLASVCVELVGGIADTGAVRNEFLCIVNALACKFCGRLAIAE
jgi:hypothetical protein